MNTRITNRLLAVAAGLALTALAPAQSGQGAQGAASQEKPSFGAAADEIQKKLQASLAELAALRESIAAEKLPMAEQLRSLEAELLAKRSEYQAVSRLLDSRTLDLGNLKTELEQRRTQSGYLSNLLGEFSRNFETRLHIVEMQRYAKQLEAARLALENTTLSDEQLFATQLEVVDQAIGQIGEALGGARFEGRAVSNGVVKPGTFVLVGPAALFRSADGLDIGAAEETNTSEPTVIPYTAPEDRDAAAQLALGTGGSFPLDTTLGNAQKVASIQETWLEHVQKGGPIMYPMFVMAAAALIVVLLKWLSMAFLRRPTKQRVQQLVGYVGKGDYGTAAEFARTLPGPAGRMLLAGANHLGEPRQLIEEIMFEQVLSTRLKLQGWLPFIAICATSAPLLGLLGTVTGIMNTFSLMTEFGAGDPKVLSSGISEALITTETGLIVAIPSLLLHAFLSRKARSLVDGMEKMALQFMNHVHAPAPQKAREHAGVA